MENIILFDWLSATLNCSGEFDLPYPYSLDHIEDFFIDGLGLDRNLFSVSSGVKGFGSRYWFDGINIHTPSEKMPYCWLEMSGSGCRAFESYGNGDWILLFRLLNEWCSIKRLDIAYDDHSGILPMMQMVEDTNAGNYVSKARSHEIIIKINDCSPDRECSIYHGSQQSNTLLRIYDKARQLDRVGEHWIRSELQLRDDNAHHAVACLLAGADVGPLYFGILNNYFRYVEPDSGDSNRWRWPLKDYWSNFIEDASRIQIASKKGIEYNLQNLDHFVFYQAGNSILTAIRVYGLRGFVHRLKEVKPFVNNPQQIALLEKLEAEGKIEKSSYRRSGVSFL